MSELNGRELAEDLARHLHDARYNGRMAWTEVPLGPVWDTPIHEGRRADVLTMEKSWARPAVRIYEVKISRGDFHRDVNAGKYQKYLTSCRQFYFACPKGLLKRADMPVGCGLIVKGENGWHVIKGAVARQYSPTRDLCMALLIQGFTEWNKGWRQVEREHLLKFQDFKQFSAAFGCQVARRIGEAQVALAEAKEMKEEIERAVGEKTDDLAYALRVLHREVDLLKGQKRYTEHAIQLAMVCDRLFTGTRFWSDAVPRELRAIADRIEKKQEAEEKGG